MACLDVVFTRWHQHVSISKPKAKRILQFTLVLINKCHYAKKLCRRQFIEINLATVVNEEFFAE